MADPQRPLRVPDRTSSMLSVPEPSEATRTVGFHRRERSRTITGPMELQVPEMLKIRRWDGAARACSPWDSLGRDPELWLRDGNCFVHLYAKGQSRRGPAFKLPLRVLLEAKCHTVVARFMTRDGVASAMASLEGRDLDFLDDMSPDARVELYIPPPPMASREEALRYHLATRNFFAWVFRRSLVGEHLGTSMINLLNSMMGFRRPGEANMDDLMAFLDEEGYLDMRNQPIHALAVLHFAEYFQSKKLYINAFTHCVGMYDELFAIPEYQIVTSVTRKLVRLAKSEMDLKLARGGKMLRNLLEDEFSETHIGLSSGSRAHLDRFRTFLHGYFTTKFGYYPPQSIDAHCQIYERPTYLAMRRDLEALYEYLVDEGFTPSEQMPPLAQGGICTLQSVHAFDMRNKYSSLQHPLPLLPEAAPTSSRRMSWLGRSDKLKPDQRLVTHATLLKATNKREPVVLKNPLVVAYRKFEEDSIFSPLKVDRHEKVSQIDARKIRWILVYSAYQVLRNCTDAPPECEETAGIRYNIAVNTASLPPWKEGDSAGKRTSVARRQTDIGPDWRYSSLVPTMPVSESPVFSSAIQPDIDYLALSNRDDSVISSISPSPPSLPPRCQSLKTRSFRRSLNIFYSSSSQSNIVELTPGSRNRMSTSFHEILVRGYGNGTKDVCVSPEGAETQHSASPAEEATGSRTPPKSKQVERLNSQPLNGRTPSTSSTSSNTSTAKSSTSGLSEALSTSTASTAPSPHPSHSPSSWAVAASGYSQELLGSKSESKMVTPPAVPRRNSRRKLLSALHPIPLRIRKGHETPPETEAGPPYDPNAWHRVDGTTTPTVMEEDEDSLWMGVHRGANGSRVDVWDQYAGVGGLTEPVPAMPALEAAKT
ncbi:hypothetical protein B0T14DRAFT_147702 [Immersiella caudata]|uniref:DUF8004 domain-containing protein n=1 Tax=Immersiella caudata TaxID=314043 RepID=A0AA40C1Z1_9PEZI|nr:hypothetical protein B0T14DRAFT_147702 [Immersiella caudata]